MKKQTKKKSTKKDSDSKITIDKLVEMKSPLEKMEEKLRKVAGDKYAFILFDIEHIPKSGDYIEVGELKAIFRKKKTKK
jgi:hypothetical protein